MQLTHHYNVTVNKRHSTFTWNYVNVGSEEQFLLLLICFCVYLSQYYPFLFIIILIFPLFYTYKVDCNAGLVPSKCEKSNNNKIIIP